MSTGSPSNTSGSSAMSERRKMGIQDALWLEMDRPSNLMVVDALMWTTEPLDWDGFMSVVQERLWDRYRVFRSVAVYDDIWYWEERSNGSLESHITRIQLPEPAGDTELQNFVSSQRTVPLDRSRPLWEVICIDDFKGGSAVLTPNSSCHRRRNPNCPARHEPLRRGP